MEKHWCMCKKIKRVRRDGDSTCEICNGKDAYGTSKLRTRKFKKTIEED